MEIRLKQLRKKAGFSNRDAFADHIGVNRHTYKSWETGAAMLSLAQAYDCAVALGCSIDEIAGLEPQGMSAPESHLLMLYRSMDRSGRAALEEQADFLCDRHPLNQEVEEAGEIGA